MMSRAEQIQFVHDLSFSVVKDIVEKIKDEKVPATWNGIELRHLMAEKFNQSTTAMNKRQKKDYDNAIIVNNL